MLKLIGKTVAVELTTVERCSGHAGTYGVKTKTHPIAMKIGKPVFRAMAAPSPDVVSSDCALAGHHIAQGMANEGKPAPELRHPLSLLRRAYGLEER
jgi:Fe-S oxidoreductase